MSLPRVLSALRVLILESSPLPSETNERREQLLHLFPHLSSSEREDLANIPPERLSIYTTSIHLGTRNILRTHCPATWNIMETSWKDAFLKPFCWKDFMQDLHQNHPWKGSETSVLLKNFAALLASEKLTPLRVSLPGLPALARFEECILRVRRHVDITPFSPNAGIPRDITIATLLQKSLEINPTCTIFSSQFDLVRAMREFHAGERPCATLAQEEAQHILIVRTSHMRVHWSTLSGQVADLFASAASTEGTFSVEALADAFLKSRRDQHESEEQQLAVFLKFLSWLLEFEALTLAPTLERS